MAKVESLVSAMEKQDVSTEADDMKTTQKPGGQPNKNMVATIKDMVQAEVDIKTRTVAIETERLKVTVQKLERQNSKLVEDVASLKTRIKKGGSQPAS